MLTSKSFRMVQTLLHTHKAKTDAPNVLVLCSDGSEEIETVTIVDVLRRAGALVELSKVYKAKDISSIKNHNMCLMSRGVNLLADSHFGIANTHIDYNAVVLPGGLQGAKAFEEDLHLMNLLRTRIAQKQLVAAICASPVIVLAKHGLLADVKKATCHPSLLKELEEPSLKQKFYRDGEPIQDKVVQCGQVVTSRGPGTSIDFSLHLVRLLFSPEKELEIRKSLIH